MYNERPNSLLLPKVTAILLVVIFLSGMTEIIFLATYARQKNYNTVNVSSKFTSKTTPPNASLENSSGNVAPAMN
jgi:hypothetical protein